MSKAGSRSRVLIFVPVAALMSLAIVAPASAAIWSVESTPAISGSSYAGFNSVSCTAANTCTAVGFNDAGVLAEHWNGTSWNVQPIAGPPASTLNGVSCKSAGFCVAVGLSGPNTATVLAERWNGSSWSIQAPPDPSAGRGAGLYDVTCVSTSACTAVGAYNAPAGSSELLLAEHWNGTAWAIQSVPLPAGLADGELTGVACATASSCVAVGTGYSNNGTFPIAARWTGSAWTTQQIGTTQGALNHVSCSSASLCTAVGYSAGAGATAERWNGTSWAPLGNPEPAGTAGVALSGISCTAPDTCTAVGRVQDTTDPSSKDLAERWDGSVWTTQTTAAVAGGLLGVSCTSVSTCSAVGSTPTSSGSAAAALGLAPSWSLATTDGHVSAPPNSALSATACSSPSSCIAVGSLHTSGAGPAVPLSERWDGSSWTALATPAPARASILAGVSCVSSTACTAVGLAGNLPLAEGWNGSAWTIETVPKPSGAVVAALNAVSCGSAAACVAVGTLDTSSGTSLALIERWNGRGWTRQSAPTVSGAVVTSLAAVSCSSASACTAVGSSTDASGGVHAVVERWNGTAWKLEATPAPQAAIRTELNGVSCSSAAVCTAVGDAVSSGSGAAPLAERWDGMRWTVEAAPAPADADLTTLVAVSCSSDNACTAVGDSSVNGSRQAAVERWNGAAWATQSVPTGIGAQTGALSGVACPADNACAAVGQEGSSSLRALAIRWDGSAWTVAPVADLSGVPATALHAVACTGVGVCVAVGGYSDGAGVALPLAERLSENIWEWDQTAVPAGQGALDGIACSSASACTAVGGAGPSTLAERWNGTTWAVQTMPATSLSSTLLGVACPSSSVCIAVGRVSEGGGSESVLAEKWNGSTWSVMSIPQPGGDSKLAAISCSAANACTAVGSSVVAGTILSVAERWNGSTWSIQPTPDVNDGALVGVDCAAPTMCMAVGSWLRGGATAPLAERWNGSVWSSATPPTPSGSGSLAGVSCPAVDTCVAVGDYAANAGAGATQMLAESWDGTSWTRQDTPNQSSDDELFGDACVSIISCSAVGTSDSGGASSTLALQYS